jgi:methylglyoxal synthase
MGALLKIEPRGDAMVLALVAHDAKKNDMLEVERSASGPQGGDLQIAALISAGKVDAVIFLRNPLTSHPHEPDIQALLKVCDIYSVALATNLASAHILLEHLSWPDPTRIEQLSAAGC